MWSVFLCVQHCILNAHSTRSHSSKIPYSGNVKTGLLLCTKEYPRANLSTLEWFIIYWIFLGQLSIIEADRINVFYYSFNIYLEGSSFKTYVHKIHGKASGWLNCVEMKAGVPYATLVAILFLSLVMVAWICCSSCDDMDNDEEKVEKVYSWFIKRFYSTYPFYLFANTGHNEVLN